MSPFSASISLKKSFVKDRFGNVLLPAEKISQSEFDLQYEKTKLVDECERLDHQNKSQSKTIKILEEKIAKIESGAKKAFNEKSDEVINLKKVLKNSHQEVANLKNEIKVKNNKIKEKEKNIHELDKKCNYLEDNLKKSKDELSSIKSEHKKLQKKLKNIPSSSSILLQESVAGISSLSVSAKSNSNSKLASLDDDNNLIPKFTESDDLCIRTGLSSALPASATQPSQQPLTPGPGAHTCSSRTSPGTPAPRTSPLRACTASETLASCSTGSESAFHLKPADSTKASSPFKFSFNMDNHFEKLYKLVEAYEKKREATTEATEPEVETS